jgi:hypothetical protein
MELGPELEGPGSESIAKDIGFGRADNLAMQAKWRLTMDAANAAVIAANGCVFGHCLWSLCRSPGSEMTANHFW